MGSGKMRVCYQNSYLKLIYRLEYILAYRINFFFYILLSEVCIYLLKIHLRYFLLLSLIKLDSDA